mgnify:CR=1 FL=1
MGGGLCRSKDLQTTGAEYINDAGGQVVCKPGASVIAQRGQARRQEIYGITEDAWAEILKVQGYRCAICRNRSRDRAPAVEHDHGTGAVRGACCKQCNHDLLGGAHDSPRRLVAALIYLLRPPTSGQWVAPEDCTDGILNLVETALDALAADGRARPYGSDEPGELGEDDRGQDGSAEDGRSEDGNGNDQPQRNSSTVTSAPSPSAAS